MDRIENIGEAPKLAPVGNPAGTQIVAAIPAPPPISHDDNSLWQPGAQSFFHDPRAIHVGDVITVNVSVADAAKLQNTTSRSRTNSDDANLTNFFGLENVAAQRHGSRPAWSRWARTHSNVGAGSINRSETINMTLAALVAQVLPNGNLVIDGHQQVRVNNELRDMRVSGIVRREDITQDNTVDLSQIAEARIILWRPGHGQRCAAAALWLASCSTSSCLGSYQHWSAKRARPMAGSSSRPPRALPVIDRAVAFRGRRV